MCFAIGLFCRGGKGRWWWLTGTWRRLSPVHAAGSRETKLNPCKRQVDSVKGGSFWRMWLPELIPAKTESSIRLRETQTFWISTFLEVDLSSRLFNDPMSDSRPTNSSSGLTPGRVSAAAFTAHYCSLSSVCCVSVSECRYSNTTDTTFSYKGNTKTAGDKFYYVPDVLKISLSALAQTHSLICFVFCF